MSDQVITLGKSFAFLKAHFVPNLHSQYLHNPILGDNATNISESQTIHGKLRSLANQPVS